MVEEEVLDEPGDHLLLGEIPKTHVDHITIGENTSSGPLWSIQMESSCHLFHHTCSCQREGGLEESSTSEAIS